MLERAFVGTGGGRRTDVQDYNSKYITQTFIGNFKGITFGLEGQFTDPGGYPQRLFLDNPNNHSKITKDQQFIDLTNKQATQMVEADRKATRWQIQQVNAQHMYYIRKVIEKRHK